MKIIYGFSLTDPVNYGHLQKSEDIKADIKDLRSVDCEGVIKVDHAELLFRSEYDTLYPNRPYLHIDGHCNKINGNFPDNIKQIYFNGFYQGIPVSYYYDFTDDELAAMVKKGMYRPNFVVPEELYKYELDMPLKCDLKIVTPQDKSLEPLVFVQIVEPHNIEVDELTCGYNFGDYFKPAPENFKSSDYVHELQEQFDLSGLIDPQDSPLSDKIDVKDNLNVTDDLADFSQFNTPNNPFDQFGEDIQQSFKLSPTIKKLEEERKNVDKKTLFEPRRTPSIDFIDMNSLSDREESK